MRKATDLHNVLNTLRELLRLQGGGRSVLSSFRNSRLFGGVGLSLSLSLRGSRDSLSEDGELIPSAGQRGLRCGL